MKKSTLVFLLVLTLAFLVFLPACERATLPENEGEAQAVLAPNSGSDAEAEAEREAETEGEKTFTITAVGDILMHNTLLRAGYQPQLQTYDFSPFFAKVQPYFETSDFVIGNLETTLGKDFSEFGGYPRFNSPAILAEYLKEAGIDLVTTANNHCLDKGITGLNNTLDFLDEAGLLHVGTARSREESENILITEIQGVKTAILAYTYGTNGLIVPKGKEFAVNLLDEAQIFNDIVVARNFGAQLVIVCLHFGQEYSDYPNNEQKRLAETFLIAGADVILGCHPHVLQPSQVYYFEEDRAQFVIYSLGNFISDQNGLPRKSSTILNLHFGINALTGEPYFKEASYVPIWTRKKVINNKPRFEVLPIEETINKIEAGALPDFTLDEIQEIQEAWVHVTAYTQPL